MNNVLILGCARSGTSILGEFFEHLPGYHYRFEPFLQADDYATAFANTDRPLAVKRPKVDHRDAAGSTPGLAFDWPALSRVFPAPFVVIWIVRHPFDAVCSLRPGILGDWNHSPRPPNWQTLQAHPWEVRCANHWANINGAGFEAVRATAKIIRYEDLVADPRKTSERLTNWIGWFGPSAGNIESWIEKIGNKKDGQTYEAKHQTRWSENNHLARVGRHRENLTSEQRHAVAAITRSAAEKFGYDLSEG